MFRRRCELAVLVVCGLVVAACAGGNEPGVDVDSLKTDIVFGVDLPDPDEQGGEQPVAPGNQPPPVQGSEPYTVPPPFSNRIPDRFKDVGFDVEPDDGGDCPAAPVGASAPSIAPLAPDSPPPEGLWRWQRSGTVETHTAAGDFTTRLTGFETRVVRNVEQNTENTWMFETVRPQDGLALVETYNVNTEPTSRTVTNPTGESARVGEPNRGVVLLSQELYDANGRLVSAFDPVGGLLLLPLPVLAGEDWRSVAVDSRTGQTAVFEGSVDSRRSVDACGKFIDGWLVKGTLTRSGGEPAETLELVFSTHMGGMLIEQHVKSTGPDQDVDVLYEIGQTKPSPAPESDA